MRHGKPLKCQSCGTVDKTTKSHVGTDEVMRCRDCSTTESLGRATKCRGCCPTEHGTKFPDHKS